MSTPLFFSAFVMNTSSHILHGVWRRLDARQTAFNSLNLWVDLAKELEAGLFDAIFFEAEAVRKSRELDEAIDPEAMIAHLGGAMDVGLDDYSLDDPISDIQTDGARSLLDWVQASVVGRPATVRDVSLLASQASRVTGTPEHIADQLAMWQEAGIDGINVINATIPGSYTEFIEHVMPVLRKHGLAEEAYSPGTLRRKLFGCDTVPATYPAAAYRNTFR